MSRPLTDRDFPLTIGVVWGMFDPQYTPDEIQFDSLAEFEGYIQGVGEADGWMEANFVANGAFYVNKDEEFVERRNASRDTSPCYRHVIWGEDPEPGTRAQTYKFDSPERAAGFERGAEDMVGWTDCRFVPTAEFLPFDVLSSALADPRMSDAVRASLGAYLDEQNIDPAMTDVVYVRLSDGAYVDEDWGPGHEVFNAPVSAPAPPRSSRPKP